MVILGLAGCKNAHIIQSSRKEAPNWVHGLAKNFIIVNGTGENHEQAKLNALSRIKEDIINSVAVHVVSKTQYRTVESSEANSIDEFVQVYNNNLEVNSDYFDALKGISLSKAEDFYWEIHRRDGYERVVYHIKYPFRESELGMLISEYERLTRELSSKLDSLTQRGYDFGTVEAIYTDIRTLEDLKYIMPGSKQTIAQNKIYDLEDLMTEIRVKTLSDSIGYLRYALDLNGNTIKSEKSPEITASCPIKVERFRAYPDVNELKYSTVECDFAQDQMLSVTYKYGGYKIRRSIPIPHNPELPSIEKVSQIALASSGLTKATWTVEVVNPSFSNFHVKSMRMFVKRNNRKPEEVKLLSLNVPGKGRGAISLEIPYEKNLKTSWAAIESLFVEQKYKVWGSLFYTNLGSDKIHEVPFEEMDLRVSH